MIISYSVWAWLYLIPAIPSVIVTIFILYDLLIDRAARIALNNHVVILLLSSGLIETLADSVWYFHLYYYGIAISPTPAFCNFWTLTDSALYVSIHILMAWASIERHILIFYPNWFGTRRKCFFFHYLPLAACLLYPLIFYFVILIIIPCNVPYNYSRKQCNRVLCFSHISWIGLWDSIGNYMMPAFLTVVFSIALGVRVLYSRYRIQRRIDWRNYKKLTLQLLPISLLYMAIQLPPMIMYAAYTGGLNRNVGADYYFDAFAFTYWTILFTPFACLVSVPDLKTKCRKVIFFWRRNRAVRPHPHPLARPNVIQMRAAMPPIG
jgi:hypothetical protein